MDHHIGDLHPFIVGMTYLFTSLSYLIQHITDREIEIIQNLLERILQYDEPIAKACDACAELDCLLSFAEASRIYDYHRPVMTEDNVIQIKQGRFVLHLHHDCIPIVLTHLGELDTRFKNKLSTLSSRMMHMCEVDVALDLSMT